MPDDTLDNEPSDTAEDLTGDQLASLHRSLLKLQEQLREYLAASRESAAPVQLDQSSVGRLTRMDAMQAQQLAAASKRQTELRLDQTRAALRLLADGDYGACRLCEEPIGYRRLQARPETPLCLTCQGRREQR